MKPSAACPYEADVLDLASLGGWPDQAEPALRAHVAGCPVCADLALIATTLRDWREASLSRVRVPDASHVWRAAGKRARADAARRATQPVRAVELTALAAAFLLIFAWGPALVGLTGLAPGAGSWLTTAWATITGAPATVVTAWRALQIPGTLASTLQWGLLTLAAWAIVVPIAFSLAGLADRTPRHESGHSGPAR